MVVKKIRGLSGITTTYLPIRATAPISAKNNTKDEDEWKVRNYVTLNVLPRACIQSAPPLTLGVVVVVETVV